MRTRTRITLASLVAALTALTTLGIVLGPNASATTTASTRAAGATVSDLGIRTIDFRFTSPSQAEWTVEVRNFGPQHLNQNPLGDAGYGIQAFLPSGNCAAPADCFLVGPDWERVTVDSRFTHRFFLGGISRGDTLDLRLSLHLGTLQGDNTHPDSVSITA